MLADIAVGIVTSCCPWMPAAWETDQGRRNIYASSAKTQAATDAMCVRHMLL
jgi:hypothetical protein